MANGQQLAEQNFQKFLKWRDGKADDYFRRIERRGIINRTEILKECGFSRSALTQNPRILNALADLEGSLRERGILSAVSSQSNSGATHAQKECPKSQKTSQFKNDLVLENGKRLT